MDFRNRLTLLRNILLALLSGVLICFSGWVLFSVVTRTIAPHRPELPLPLTGSISNGEGLNLDLIFQSGGGFDNLYLHSPAASFKILAVREDVIYIGLGPRLALLDISNPKNINLLGLTEPLPAYIYGVALAGNTAFIASGPEDETFRRRLYIVDVSDPAHPKTLDPYTSTDWDVGSIVAVGNYLYVTGSAAKDRAHLNLYILDIKDPARPEVTGIFTAESEIQDVAVSGSVAYIATADSGLRIVDISNPEKPRESGAVFPSGYTYRVISTADRVYLHASLKVPRGMRGDLNGLYILDCSDPTNPVEASFYPEPYGTLIAVDSEVAYWGASDSRSITYIDITNPKQPRFRAERVLSSPEIVVAVDRKKEIVLTRESLQIFDVSNPLHPSRSGSYEPAVFDEISVSDTVAVLYDRFRDIVQVLDISNPAAPVPASRLTTLETRYIMDLLVQQRTLYLLGEGFAILDLSNPARPRSIGQYGPGIDFVSFAISSGLAYLAGSDHTIHILDIADPANPRLIARFTEFVRMNQPVKDIQLVENTLYVLAEDLHILDVSNPGQPSPVTVLKFPNATERMVLIEDILFIEEKYQDWLREWQFNLVGVDVSDPTRPVVLGKYGWYESYNIGGHSQSCIYVTGSEGIHLLNFSKPMSPTEFGFYGLSDLDTAAFAGDNMLYVISEKAGLYGLRHSAP